MIGKFAIFSGDSLSVNSYFLMKKWPVFNGIRPLTESDS